MKANRNKLGQCPQPLTIVGDRETELWPSSPAVPTVTSMFQMSEPVWMVGQPVGENNDAYAFLFGQED